MAVGILNTLRVRSYHWLMIDCCKLRDLSRTESDQETPSQSILKLHRRPQTGDYCRQSDPDPSSFPANKGLLAPIVCPSMSVTASSRCSSNETRNRDPRNIESRSS